MFSRIPSLALGLVMVGVACRPAAGQICLGNMALSRRAIRVTLAGERVLQPAIQGGVPFLGAEIAVPAGRFFAKPGVDLVLFGDDTRFERMGLAERTADDVGATVLRASGGYRIALRATGSIELCPILGVSRQNGPGLMSNCTPLPEGGYSCDGVGRGQARTYWFGASAGYVLPRSEALVLFVSAGYSFSRLTTRAGSGRARYVGIAAGAGVGLGALTVRPALFAPLGLEDASMGMTVGFALRLG